MVGYLDGLADASATRSTGSDRRSRSRSGRGGRASIPEAASRGPVTLSTFHGCPPDEIAAIGRHLMARHGLDLRGQAQSDSSWGSSGSPRSWAGELGYAEIRLRRRDFEADLSFPAGARPHRRVWTPSPGITGAGFGIKLTNTLVVENHKVCSPATRCTCPAHRCTSWR